MVDRTGLGTTTLHYLAVRQAMASAHRIVHSKMTLTCLAYLANWVLSRCSGSPFPCFAQVFFALIVQIKLSAWAVTKTQLTRTVDYVTTSMGTSAIHLCSIKSSLPSLYPLRHSRDQSFQALYCFFVLQVTESWAEPGNEANFPYLITFSMQYRVENFVTSCDVMYLEVDRHKEGVIMCWTIKDVWMSQLSGPNPFIMDIIENQHCSRRGMCNRSS